MLEADLPKEIQAKKGEHHYPDCKVNLPVKDVPVVGLVRHGKELEAEGYFHEAQHHLHAIEPATALWKFGKD